MTFFLKAAEYIVHDLPVTPQFAITFKIFKIKMKPLVAKCHRHIFVPLVFFAGDLTSREFPTEIMVTEIHFTAS